MSISLKILKLQQLDKKLIKNICNLKRTFWKFSLNSHLIWFKNFVKKNDVHILLYNKKILIGYNLLRTRTFFKNSYKTSNKYFYFDTLIIAKKYRGKNFSKRIIEKSLKISKKSDLPIILICQKKSVNFYKKYEFELINNNKVQFVDHKFNTCCMIYSRSKNLFFNTKFRIFTKK